MSEFHAGDGWYFSRTEDGSVRVRANGAAIIFDAATWASIIASVCADGETAQTFGLAIELHNGHARQIASSYYDTPLVQSWDEHR